MARGLPEVFAADVGRIEDFVAPLPVALPPVLLDDRPDAGALGMPEDQPSPQVLGRAEQVQLLAETAVVTLLGLFQETKITLQFLGRGKGRAVNPLQLDAPLVALPVSSRDGEKLEMLEAAGGGKMRSQAEVGETVLAVQGDDVSAFFLDQLHLERLPSVFEQADRFLLRQHLPDDRCVGRGDLPHFGLDRVQVVGRKRLVPEKIIIKTVLHGRPDAGLRPRKQVQDGMGEQVGGAVAQNVQRRFPVLFRFFHGHFKRPVPEDKSPASDVSPDNEPLFYGERPARPYYATAGVVNVENVFCFIGFRTSLRQRW